MTLILRGLLALITLFFLAMGAGMFLVPHQVAPVLLVAGTEAGGWGTLRGDLGAFFLLGAIATGHAVLSGRSSLLAIPLFLIGMALSGRLLSIGLDGYSAAAVPSMVTEAVLIAGLAAGRFGLPR